MILVLLFALIFLVLAALGVKSRISLGWLGMSLWFLADHFEQIVAVPGSLWTNPFVLTIVALLALVAVFYLILENIQRTGKGTGD